MEIDFTHDAQRQSWVGSAEDHSEFPLQNMPLASFRPQGESRFRLGVGIGDRVLDLSACSDLFEPGWRSALLAERMNELMGWPAERRLAFRHRLSTLLGADCPELRDDEAPP